MSADALLSRLESGNHRLRCPDCGRGERDRTMGVTVEHDRIVWHCHRCGQAGAQRDERVYQRLGARPAPSSTPMRHVTLAAQWCSIWAHLQPIAGTPAADYLRARGCALPPDDGDLRYGELRHPSGYAGPCMVALVTGAVTREPLTLHRTWIKSDGTKADVDPPRMLLGKHRKQGGVIRLFPDECVTIGLAISEGIETALAVAHVFKPVWSAIDAGNLAAFPVLGGIESLTIVADHDDAGIRAARECAARWHHAGREVRIATPPKPGTDAANLAEAA